MDILAIIQITVSLLLIAAILLQQRGTALGSGFGGEGGNFFAKKRGPEKFLFAASVVLAILFVALSILNFVI